MTDPLVWLGGVLIAVCLAGIFGCSLAEAAFLGMTETRKRRLAELPDPRAGLVLRLLADSRYLSAIIVGMNLFVIIISTVMTLLVGHALHGGAPWLQEGLHIGTVLGILVFCRADAEDLRGAVPRAGVAGGRAADPGPADRRAPAGGGADPAVAPDRPT